MKILPCFPIAVLISLWLPLAFSSAFQNSVEIGSDDYCVKEDTIEIKLFPQRITGEGRGISQVFLVSKEGRIHHNGDAKEIVKPKQIGEKKLAYTRIYFTGRAGEIEKGIIVLLTDYDTEKPSFFIDQNNNLDFTDDGKTEVLSSKNGGFVLELFGDDKNSKFVIELMPFRNEKKMSPEKKEQFRDMFRGFEEHMGGEFADAEHWYFNRRLNTRTASVEVDGQKTMLGLLDYDCDGLYSGERDRLMLGEFEGKNISSALADGAVKLTQDAIFLIGEQPYQIIETKDDGSLVRIKKSEKMPDRLFVGSTIPDLTLTSFDGESVQLKELVKPARLLILDFWGHWCGPCVSSIPSTIKFHEKWKEEITFVGVHFGEHDAAKQLVDEHKIPFAQFEVTDELKESFFVDAWPSYVVIDEKGKVFSFRSTLKKIAELLEDQQLRRGSNDQR